MSICLDSTAWALPGHNSNNAWPGGASARERGPCHSAPARGQREPQRVRAGLATTCLRVARGSVS
eukprot:15866-Prorocentrum_lima.AAC.1